MSFLGADTFSTLNFSTPTPNRHGSFNIATGFSSPMDESYPYSQLDSSSDSPQALSPVQILQAATHNRLMQSGNLAYHNLLLRNTSLEAEAQTLRSTYTQLMAQLSSKSTSSSQLSKPAHKVYRHEDYPNVTIWTAQDWQVHPKNKKNDEAGIHQVSANQTSKKPNAPRTSMFYIQKEDGSSVTEIEAGQICTQARLIWEALHAHGIAPDRWGRMYSFREYLRFGEGDWKAQRLAIDTYPGWARGRGLLKGRVKMEAKEEPVEDSLVGESTQRKTKKRKDPPMSTSTPKAEKLMKPQTTSTQVSPSTNTTTGTASMPVANIDGPPNVTTPSVDSMPVTPPAAGPTAPLSTIAPTSMIAPTSTSAPITPTVPSTISPTPNSITPAATVPAMVAAPVSLSTVSSPLAEVDQVTTSPDSPVLLPTDPPTTISVASITSPILAPLALVQLTTVDNPLAHVAVIDKIAVVNTTLATAADNHGTNPPALPSPIVTRTPPSPVDTVACASSPLPVVEPAQITNARPLKIKLKIINPLSKSVVPVPAPDEPSVERFSSASRVSSSDPTPAQPLSSNVVNTAPAAAAGPWFRFQPNSNSELNLFGRHFCKDLARKVSRKEVTDAFDSLSVEEKKTWTDQRAENLAAKKERRKQ